MNQNPGLIGEILSALKRTIQYNDEQRVVLHRPHFSGNEWTYVKDCLDTGWVSSVGQYVDRFEHDLAEYTGARYAVAVVNGTAALHVCLLLCGVRPDDEVLVPSLTFIATANAISYCQAIPHFVDSEESTLGVNAIKLANYLCEIATLHGGECFNRLTGRRISALVPMHTFGHPVELEAIQEICAQYSITLIEDAAESLGSFYKGQHTGTFGKMSALSFNGNKIITTGGGGAIMTNDETLAKRAKHITTTAKVPHPWHFIHDQIGFNYRMPNINAALGCAQLEQLPAFLENKRKLAETYAKEFSCVPGVRFFGENTVSKSNYWLNALILDSNHKSELESLLQATNEAGIMTRPIWQLLHTLPMFKDCPRMDLNDAIDLESRIINIPSGAYLIE
jgi:perosamine synthetase